jgi:hypothetical protein
MDLPPFNMDRENFIDSLNETLINPHMRTRNPLLISQNAASSFSDGKLLEYGVNKWLCYPSVYVQLFPAPKPTNVLSLVTGPTEPVYKITKCGNDVFIGIVLGTGSKWPGKCWIDGKETSDILEIELSSDYTKNVVKNADHLAGILHTKLIYFPEIGPKIIDQPFEIKFPKNTSISFNTAFCVCSSSVKQLFTNKKHKI